MKSFFSAVARFLRAMPRFVYERIQVAGEWVSRLVAVPAEPAPIEPAGTVTAAEDEDSVATRAIAANLLAGRIQAPELSGRVSEDRFAWLCSLSPTMLKAVVNADRQALRDHLRQKRNLKGVLAADAATVRTYNKRRFEDELEADVPYRPAFAM